MIIPENIFILFMEREIKIKSLFSIVLVILFLTCYSTYSQKHVESNHKIRLGFNYGFGKQESFPFNSIDYSYDVQFYKFQLNYQLMEKRKWIFEINMEPAIYFSEHQLLNKYYVRPDSGDDYLIKRLEYTSKKQIKEYVLNIGLLAKYKIFNSLGVYILGSVGPMYFDTDTERMNEGFAFSDIFGLGITYKIKRIYLDMRYSIRHVSNLNISLPNNGLNSTNIEFGLTYTL